MDSKFSSKRGPDGPKAEKGWAALSRRFPLMNHAAKVEPDHAPYYAFMCLHCRLAVFEPDAYGHGCKATRILGHAYTY